MFLLTDPAALREGARSFGFPALRTLRGLITPGKDTISGYTR